MTAFDRSMIPASITTLEGLNIWAGMCLSNLYPDMTNTEGTDTSNAVLARVAQSNIYYMAVGNPANWRVISRSSIRVAPIWQTGATKIWANAVEFGATPIPADFKV
jgi:hypothetical protein